MRLFVYDMFVNVIYYVHVCEQARWAGNSAIENLCIIIYLSIQNLVPYTVILYIG